MADLEINVAGRIVTVVSEDKDIFNIPGAIHSPLQTSGDVISAGDIDKRLRESKGNTEKYAKDVTGDEPDCRRVAGAAAEERRYNGCVTSDASKDVRDPEYDISAPQVGRRKSPLDWADDQVDAVIDFFAEVTHSLEYATKTLFKRFSTENLPECNVHWMHPTTKQLFSFGFHIVNHDFGCQVFRVLDGGLASKMKLRAGDIVCKINGRDLQRMTLGGVMEMISGIDVTHSISLTICRLTEESDGSKGYDILRLDIVLTLTEDNVRLELDVLVTSTEEKYRYQNTSMTKYILQKKLDQSQRHLRLDANGLEMSTTLDDKCRFRFELYQGGSARICVLRNEQSDRVLRGADTGLGTKMSNAPQRTAMTANDNMFFKYHRSSEFDTFESAIEPGRFVATTDENRLVLKHFPDGVDLSGRFTVVKAT